MLEKKRLKSNILLWTLTYGHTSVSKSAKTYIHQLCVDTGCSLENLPGVVDDLFKNYLYSIGVFLHRVLRNTQKCKYECNS